MKVVLRSAVVLYLSLCAALADGPQQWPLPDKSFFAERIPPPPATGSAGDIADLDFSMAVQANASPDEIRAATIAAVFFNVFAYSHVLGPNFTPAAYPKTAAFFARLEATVNAPKNVLKDHFHRLRPVDAHKDLVKQLVPYEAGFSYPSGHSTRSWLDALVLGDLNPANRLAFLREAARVGFLRVVGGMHYQNDVIVSRTLAQLVYEQLKADPTFMKDFNDLKAAEWKQPPPLNQ